MAVNTPRILADENMPFAREAFATLGDVRAMGGRTIAPADVAAIDGLMVRSITKVNADLLGQSPVTFVGTATIGVDHVDTAWLAQRKIAFASAPGCNANSVSEYILAVLLEMAARKGFTLKGRTLGIVGVGNVGSRVAVKARAAGMEVILNDPPLAEMTGDKKYRPLDEIFAADFVTLHVPLEKAGPHPTHHMADASFFKRLGSGKGFINASRGGVHDTAALKAAIAKEDLLFCALDVWEKEPEIDLDLLAVVDIATPHIAGYSFEGKVNGTGMIYDAACAHFGVPPAWKRASVLGTPRAVRPAFTGRYEDDLRTAVRGNYDVYEDDRNLRAVGRPGAIGPGFDRLRKEYRVRREFTNTALAVGRNTDPGLVRTLKDLLFNVTTEGGTQ